MFKQIAGNKRLGKILRGITRVLISIIRRILIFAKKIIRGLFTVVGIIRGFNLLKAFEPKEIFVDEAWLSGIVMDINNRMLISDFENLSLNSKVPITVAKENLDLLWNKIKSQKKAHIVLPIYCFQNVDPYIKGVESLLKMDLPTMFVDQISALGFEKPFRLRFQVGNKTGVISSSIIDITQHRILIVGGSRYILEQLQIIGKRFHAPSKEPDDLAKHIREILITYSKNPLGSRLLIGGFASVLGFEATLLFEKVFTYAVISLEESFSFVLGMFAFLLFLCQEFFEDNIYAYEAFWCAFPNYLSWLLFLLFVIASPLLLLIPNPSHIIAEVVSFYSIGLIIVCSITNLGKIFFGYGLTKKTWMSLWIAILIFIIVLYTERYLTLMFLSY